MQDLLIVYVALRCPPSPFVENAAATNQVTSSGMTSLFSCFIGYRLATGLITESTQCNNDFIWEDTDNCRSALLQRQLDA